MTKFKCLKKHKTSNPKRVAATHSFCPSLCVLCVSVVQTASSIFVSFVSYVFLSVRLACLIRAALRHPRSSVFVSSFNLTRPFSCLSCISWFLSVRLACLIRVVRGSRLLHLNWVEPFQGSLFGGGLSPRVARKRATLGFGVKTLSAFMHEWRATLSHGFNQRTFRFLDFVFP
jgi:hypothetical protein